MLLPVQVTVSIVGRERKKHNGIAHWYEQKKIVDAHKNISISTNAHISG